MLARAFIAAIVKEFKVHSSVKPMKSARPLSPHLQVYRWQYTMALSVLHRATGCILAAGLILFVYWLVSLASGAQAYAQALAVLAHPVTKIVWVGLSFSFFYHLLNGVRHLVWDTGHGLERAAARKSGWVAFIGAVLCTAFFWFLLVAKTSGTVA